MSLQEQVPSLRRKKWIEPRLERLAADLQAVAGRNFPPGDGTSGAGKSLIPPFS